MQERQGMWKHHTAVLGDGCSEPTLTLFSREAQSTRAQDRLEHTFTMTGLRYTTNRNVRMAAYTLKPLGT